MQSQKWPDIFFPPTKNGNGRSVILAAPAPQRATTPAAAKPAQTRLSAPLKLAPGALTPPPAGNAPAPAKAVVPLPAKRPVAGKWPDIFFIPPDVAAANSNARKRVSPPQLIAPSPTPLLQRIGATAAPATPAQPPETFPNADAHSNVLLPTQIPLKPAEIPPAPASSLPGAPAPVAGASSGLTSHAVPNAPMSVPTALPTALDAPKEVMVSEPGMLFSGATDASPSQPLKLPTPVAPPISPAATLMGLGRPEVPKITLPARMEDEPAFQPMRSSVLGSTAESSAVIPGVPEEEGGSTVIPGLPEDDDVIPGLAEEDVIPGVPEEEQDSHPLLESEAVIPGVVISQSQEIVTPVKSVSGTSGVVTDSVAVSRSTTVSVGPAPSPAVSSAPVAGPLITTAASTLADVSPDSPKEFLLTNGERISGKVLHEKDDWIYLQSALLGVVTIPRDMIARRPMEVILINGDRVSGEIIAETKEHIYLLNDALGMLTIPRRAAPRKIVEAITRNGDRIVGELLSETKEQLVIRSAALGTITIRFDGLQKLNTKAEQAALTAG